MGAEAVDSLQQYTWLGGGGGGGGGGRGGMFAVTGKEKGQLRNSH